MPQAFLTDLVAQNSFITTLFELKSSGRTSINLQEFINLGWLLQARQAAAKSNDPATKVGAVIVHNNNILATGYNHFVVEQLFHRDQLEVMMFNREFKLKHIVHAEVDALRNLMEQEKKLLPEATLYVFPIQPCIDCAQQIVDSGIKKVIAPVHTDCDESCSTCKGNNFNRWSESFKKAERIFWANKVELTLVPIKNIQQLFPPLPDMDNIRPDIATASATAKPEREERKKMRLIS